jgi:hypothetical protein
MLHVVSDPLRQHTLRNALRSQWRPVAIAIALISAAGLALVDIAPHVQGYLVIAAGIALLRWGCIPELSHAARRWKARQRGG